MSPTRRVVFVFPPAPGVGRRGGRVRDRGAGRTGQAFGQRRLLPRDTAVDRNLDRLDPPRPGVGVPADLDAAVVEPVDGMELRDRRDRASAVSAAALPEAAGDRERPAVGRDVGVDRIHIDPVEGSRPRHQVVVARDVDRGPARLTQTPVDDVPLDGRDDPEGEESMSARRRPTTPATPARANTPAATRKTARRPDTASRCPVRSSM